MEESSSLQDENDCHNPHPEILVRRRRSHYQQQQQQQTRAGNHQHLPNEDHQDVHNNHNLNASQELSHNSNTTSTNLQEDESSTLEGSGVFSFAMSTSDLTHSTRTGYRTIGDNSTLSGDYQGSTSNGRNSYTASSSRIYAADDLSLSGRPTSKKGRGKSMTETTVNRIRRHKSTATARKSAPGRRKNFSLDSRRFADHEEEALPPPLASFTHEELLESIQTNWNNSKINKVRAKPNAGATAIDTAATIEDDDNKSVVSLSAKQLMDKKKRKGRRSTTSTSTAPHYNLNIQHYSQLQQRTSIQDSLHHNHSDNNDDSHSNHHNDFPPPRRPLSPSTLDDGNTTLSSYTRDSRLEKEITIAIDEDALKPRGSGNDNDNNNNRNHNNRDNHDDDDDQSELLSPIAPSAAAVWKQQRNCRLPRRTYSASSTISDLNTTTPKSLSTWDSRSTNKTPATREDDEESLSPLQVSLPPEQAFMKLNLSRDKFLALPLHEEDGEDDDEEGREIRNTHKSHHPQPHEAKNRKEGTDLSVSGRKMLKKRERRSLMRKAKSVSHLHYSQHHHNHSYSVLEKKLHALAAMNQDENDNNDRQVEQRHAGSGKSVNTKRSKSLSPVRKRWMSGCREGSSTDRDSTDNGKDLEDGGGNWELAGAVSDDGKTLLFQRKSPRNTKSTSPKNNKGMGLGMPPQRGRDDDSASFPSLSKSMSVPNFGGAHLAEEDEDINSVVDEARSRSNDIASRNPIPRQGSTVEPLPAKKMDEILSFLLGEGLEKEYDAERKQTSQRKDKQPQRRNSGVLSEDDEQNETSDEDDNRKNDANLHVRQNLSTSTDAIMSGAKQKGAPSATIDTNADSDDREAFEALNDQLQPKTGVPAASTASSPPVHVERPTTVESLSTSTAISDAPSITAASPEPSTKTEPEKPLEPQGLMKMFKKQMRLSTRYLRKKAHSYVQHEEDVAAKQSMASIETEMSVSKSASFDASSEIVAEEENKEGQSTPGCGPAERSSSQFRRPPPKGHAFMRSASVPNFSNNSDENSSSRRAKSPTLEMPIHEDESLHDDSQQNVPLVPHLTPTKKVTPQQHPASSHPTSASSSRVTTRRKHRMTKAASVRNVGSSSFASSSGTGSRSRRPSSSFKPPKIGDIDSGGELTPSTRRTIRNRKDSARSRSKKRRDSGSSANRSMSESRRRRKSHRSKSASVRPHRPRRSATAHEILLHQSFSAINTRDLFQSKSDEEMHYPLPYGSSHRRSDRKAGMGGSSRRDGSMRGSFRRYTSMRNFDESSRQSSSRRLSFSVHKPRDRRQLMKAESLREVGHSRRDRVSNDQSELTESMRRTTKTKESEETFAVKETSRRSSKMKQSRLAKSERHLHSSTSMSSVDDEDLMEMNASRSRRKRPALGSSKGKAPSRRSLQSQRKYSSVRHFESGESGDSGDGLKYMRKGTSSSRNSDRGNGKTSSSKVKGKRMQKSQSVRHL